MLGIYRPFQTGSRSLCVASSAIFSDTTAKLHNTTKHISQAHDKQTNTEPYTSKEHHDTQAEFLKKIKKLVLHNKTNAEFSHRKKVLHRNVNYPLAKLMNFDEKIDKFDYVSPNFQKEEWLERDVVLQIAEQHAYFLELAGRKTYSKPSLDSIETEKILAALYDRVEFNFWMHKWRYIEKKEETKLKKSLICPNTREKDSYLPYCNLMKGYRRNVNWKLMSQASSPDLPIVFDMSFDRLMSEREIKDSVAQIRYCVGFNLFQHDPFPILFTNVRPDSHLYQDFTSRGLSGFPNSYFNVTSKDIFSVDNANPEDVIYLSPDSYEEMESFELDKMYIIGGLVDKNQRLGQKVTLSLSKRLGIKSVKLPLTKYLIWGNSTGRDELSLDIVFKILHTMRATGNWPKALQHIPARFHRGITELGMQEAQRFPEVLDWYESIEKQFTQNPKYELQRFSSKKSKELKWKRMSAADKNKIRLAEYLHNEKI